MKTYCVKGRKDTENIDPKMVRRKNNRLIMQSKCSVCGIKKSRFVKEQKAKGLLSNLGIKTPLSKIQLLNVFLTQLANIGPQDVPRTLPSNVLRTSPKGPI